MSEDDRGSLWAGGDADRAEPPPRPFQRAEQAAEAPDDAPAGRLPPAPHADRFRFVLGALAGLAVAAVVAAVLLAGRSDGGPDGGWSAWKPTAEGTRGAEQIASYVGASYRGKGGKQLVAVKAGPLKVADLDLNVALEGANGQIQVFQGEGLRYTMCGLGPNCSMADGKPTLQRGLLLQREALELALYSFHTYPESTRSSPSCRRGRARSRRRARRCTSTRTASRVRSASPWPARFPLLRPWPIRCAPAT